MRPRFSIVIPARDEARCLARTLGAIGRLTCRDFETIVVANGCRDQTARIAEPYARVIRLDEPGSARARNTGAMEARGDVILHLDADVVLSPRALEVAAERFDSRHAVGTFEARPHSRSLWHRGVFSLHNIACRTGLYRSTMGTIVCHRDQFLNVGGFDERRMPRANRDLIRRLLRFGSYCYLRAPVTVSTRRWERWGAVKLLRFWLRFCVRDLTGRFDASEYEQVR